MLVGCDFGVGGSWFGLMCVGWFVLLINVCELGC